MIYQVLGNLWIMLWTWRFLIQRLPQPLNNHLWLIGVILIGIHLVSLIIQLYLYIQSHKKGGKLSMFLNKVINVLYWEPLKSISLLLLTLSKTVNDILFNIGALLNRLNTTNLIKAFIYATNYMPKALFIVIFYYDVCILKKLNFIYLALPLIFIPLFLNSFLFIINLHMINVKTYLEVNSLSITNLPNNTFTYSLKPNGTDYDLKLWSISMFFINMFKAMTIFRYHWFEFKRLNIFFTFNYLLIWITILIICIRYNIVQYYLDNIE